MRKALLCGFFLAIAAICGCGGDKIALDTRPLTDEEKAKIKVEDAQVEDEESQGKVKGGKKSK